MVSRDIGVPIYRLEIWRNRALDGIDMALDPRKTMRLAELLAEANQRIAALGQEVARLRGEGDGEHG